MLYSLSVSNYILIGSLETEFPEGLIIISGETGAGKSILLGALSLVLGAKAEASMVGPTGENCVVEAVFGIDDTVRRILADADLPSEDDRLVLRRTEAFMGDVVRNLGIMQGKGYKIVMYAPSKVRTFDTIEGTAYHDAALHICSSYHVDYSDPQVDRFVHQYRSLFRTEPSQFAFQGYDTARYFIVRCIRYGNAWTRNLGAERSSGLHTASPNM